MAASNTTVKNAEAFIVNYGAEFKRCIDQLPVYQIATVAEQLLNAYQQDRIVAVIGNGGSAATASHIACDLGKTILGHKDPRSVAQRFKVMAMTDNMPIVTAWANDESYDSVFAEQLRAWVSQGDILLAISASGNSENIVKGVEMARQLGAYTIGFLGFQGGKVADMVDLPIIVRSENYGYIEDLHMMFGHMVTAYIRTMVGFDQEHLAPEAQHLFATKQRLQAQFSDEINVAAD